MNEHLASFRALDAVHEMIEDFGLDETETALYAALTMERLLQAQEEELTRSLLRGQAHDDTMRPLRDSQFWPVDRLTEKQE